MPGNARHVSVVSAAARPRWVTRSHLSQSGGQEQVRFNARLRKASDQPEYPVAVMVDIPRIKSDWAIFPVSHAAARSAGIEAAVADLAGDHAVLAAVISDARGRRFLLYARDTDWLPEFEAEFRAVAGDREVGIGVDEHDDQWRFFRDRRPKARKRDAVITVLILSLVWGMVARRYGFAWAGADVTAIAAFLILESQSPGPRQRARRAVVAASHSCLHASYFFALLALFWHPGSPWACAGVACASGVAFSAVLWFVQSMLYLRMTDRAGTGNDRRPR